MKKIIKHYPMTDDLLSDEEIFSIEIGLTAA